MNTEREKYIKIFFSGNFFKSVTFVSFNSLKKLDPDLEADAVSEFNKKPESGSGFNETLTFTSIY